MKTGKYKVEYEAFQRYLAGKRVNLKQFVVLSLKSVLALFEGLIRYIPGGFGYLLRYWFYKLLLKKIGKNVLIDVGVQISGPANISIGDFTWIDAYCRLEGYLGEISIGRRVHIAPFSIIAAREPVTIGDYVGIGAGAKIYANSEAPKFGKRMSGPMVPEEFKAFVSKPITLEKDSFIGANSVLLPGAHLEEGAVVGANTVLARRVRAYKVIFQDIIISSRERVTVEDD